MPSNIFEICELNKFKNDLKMLYENSNIDWVQYGSIELQSLHTGYVSTDEKIIKKLLSVFKDHINVVENIKFFKILANGEVSPHKDKRKTAINIPIISDLKNTLNFYKEQSESKEVKILIKNKEKDTTAKKYIKKNIAESINTINSFCINTNTIHGVETNVDFDRIVLSISFKNEYDDFYKIKEMYQSGNLLC